MKPKPRIYLDLDGVVYPIDRLDRSGGTPEGVDYRHEKEWWRKDVVEKLGELSVGSVELVIASSWGEMFMNPKLHSPLGALKPARALPIDWRTLKPEEVALDINKSPAPYVWIDDDLSQRWIDQVRGGVPASLPGLMVKPYRQRGLTVDELAAIEEGFLDQL